MWELELFDEYDREYMGDADIAQRPEVGTVVNAEMREVIIEIISIDEEGETAKVVVGYQD